MKHLRMLTLAAMVLAPLLLPVTASATQLTSPSGTIYTGTVSAKSSGLSWHGPFTTITCNRSELDGTVESHGSSTTTKIALSSLSFSECNFVFKILKRGTLEIHTEDSTTNDGKGLVTWSGMELTIETSIANCLFTTSNTYAGTLAGSDTKNAEWFISDPIPRTGHSIFCGSSAVLTGSYTITTPSTLTVD